MNAGGPPIPLPAAAPRSDPDDDVLEWLQGLIAAIPPIPDDHGDGAWVHVPADVLAAIRRRAARAAAGTETCVCGHPRSAHEHYRSGADCAFGDCDGYTAGP